MVQFTQVAKHATMDVHSGIQSYLRDISGIPLLTADEEKELGWAIINEACPLARQRMIACNLRLVVAIAKRRVTFAVSLSDLIEEGNLGLIRAVDGFDPAFGVRFSTYASQWIKQAVRSAVNEGTHPVRFPAYVFDLASRWRTASNSMRELNGRLPTSEEMSRAMAVPLRSVRTIRRAIRLMRSFSDHGPAAAEERLRTVEVVPDRSVAAPERGIMKSEDSDILRRLIDAMPEREARILKMRFGLHGSDAMTLTDISLHFGVGRERIRQICDEAVATLQSRWADGRFGNKSPEPSRHSERPGPSIAPKRRRRTVATAMETTCV